MYSSGTLEDVPFYACLNAVLAMGTMLQQTMSIDSEPFSVPQDSEAMAASKAWRYFRNASSNLVELMFKSTPMSLQAILTMVRWTSTQVNSHLRIT